MREGCGFGRRCTPDAPSHESVLLCSEVLAEFATLKSYSRAAMRCCLAVQARVASTALYARSPSCVAVLLMSGVYDACKYDLSDCMNVPRSSECELVDDCSSQECTLASNPKPYFLRATLRIRISITSPSLLCAVARSETCTIRCRYPYTGPDFNATCASENIAASLSAEWRC